VPQKHLAVSSLHHTLRPKYPPAVLWVEVKHRQITTVLHLCACVMCVCVCDVCVCFLCGCLCVSAYILPREGEEESLVYTASAGALIATKLCGSILDTVIMVARIESQTR